MTLDELAQYGRVIVDGAAGDWWVTLDSLSYGEFQGRGATFEAARAEVVERLEGARGKRADADHTNGRQGDHRPLANV